jgi:hypothetical protein
MGGVVVYVWAQVWASRCLQRVRSAEENAWERGWGQKRNKIIPGGGAYDLTKMVVSKIRFSNRQ